MKLEEEKQLLTLLNKYQEEQLKQDSENAKEKGYHQIFGTKAKFNHARVLARHIAVEIEQRMTT